MAKKPKSKSKPQTQTKKKQDRDPKLEDVVRILAIQSYAASIERRAIEFAITYPKRFDALQAVLSKTIKTIKCLPDLDFPLDPTPDDPDGQDPPESCIRPWVLCNDGICRLEEECS